MAIFLLPLIIKALVPLLLFVHLLSSLKVTLF
jgi:hypothetical protein